MTIQFDLISSSRRSPGVESEINTKGAQQSPSPNRQRLMIVGQGMSSKISTPSFIPSGTPGLNDLALGTTPAAPTYTGSTLRQFIIEITTAAATDVFKWSDDGGATWTTGVNASTNDIALSNGVDVKFGAATGHAVGDRWNFFAFPAGTVAQKIPTACLREGDAAAFFGIGSVLHRTIKACLETAEVYGNVDINATSMDDAAGTAANDGYFQIVGTATGAGYVRFYIGNERFEVGYSIGDTADVIALAIKNELDKQKGLDLMVMWHRLAGTLARIKGTCKHAGTIGNAVKLEAQWTPNTGVSVTVTQFTNGATDPSNLGDALDAFQGQRYHIIGLCLNDATSLTALKTHLDVVSNTTAKKYAIGVFGMNDTTFSDVTTRASGVNHERVQCVYLKGSRSAHYEIMAAYCALRTYIGDPAQQLNGKRLYGLHVPGVQSRLTEAEAESALWNGVTPLMIDSSEYVAVFRAITTAVSRGDFFVDVSTILTLDYFRTAINQRHAAVFQGERILAETPANVRDQNLFVARELEAGRPYKCLRYIDQYESQFISETDPSDPNRINSAIPAPVVPGLHRLCNRIDLIWG